MLDLFKVKITKIVRLPKVVMDNYPEEYEGIEDLVTVVHIEVTANKNNNSITEEHKFHIPYNKNVDFIEYKDLKEQTVLSWISNDIEDLKLKLESFLDNQEPDIQDNIDNETTLPWNSN